jgi:hypothetical protein
VIIRRALTTVVAVAIVAGIAVAGTVAPARAASQPAQVAPANLAAVTETAKVTLPETSIAGPGFDGAIAWTGTDAAHHLNVRIGTGGLAFPTKTILPETSPVGPALLGEPGSQPLTVDLAWTGTDAAHHVNVEFGPPNGTKLTLHETSFATPAIARGIVGDVEETLVAWTGTDANHSLNVLAITRAGTGPTVMKKTVLSQFSSDAGPSLVGLGNPSGPSEFVLGWSVRGTQRLNLATSTDGVAFTSALGAGLPQLSATAPQLAEQTNAQGQKERCIAWTGTDAAHHLNVQCTTTFPQFPDAAHTKTVLPETALGVPGFGGVGRGNGVIAWTGTDAARHLNVAELTFP